VLTLLHALEAIFTRQGWLSRPGSALQAAAQAYARPQPNEGRPA
jgi:hypothetical protein